MTAKSPAKRPTKPGKGSPRGTDKSSAGLVAAIVLAALCLGLYGNALPNGFVFDDVEVVQHDVRVIQGDYGRLLTEEYWTEGHHDRLYRPLVSVSYALNWALSGQPWTFRLPNLLLHFLVCLLVFYLARELFGSVLVGALAGGLFAIHPIHTEPLNAIVGRADLACTVLMLLAALLWWRDGHPRRLRHWATPLGASLCFAAAALCKESALTLAGIILLLDWWRWRSGDGPVNRAWLSKRVWRCYVPMVVIVAGYLALRIAVLGQLTNVADVDRLDNPIATPAQMLGPDDSAVLVRFGTVLATFGKAASLMLWPTPLMHDYSYRAFEEVRRLSDWRMWMGLGWLALVVIACVLSYRRKSRVLVAIGLALIPYALVSNVFLLIGTIFGERLLYTPSVGVCLAIGLVAAGVLERLRDFWRKGKRAGGGWAFPIAAVMVLVCIWYGYLVIERNRDWRSAETLARSIPNTEHISFKVLSAYADLAIERRDYERAREDARRAMEMAPEAWVPYVPAAIVCEKTGNMEAAMALYRKALELGAGVDSRTLHRASEMLLKRGEHANAITLLRQLVKLRPDSVIGHNNLADALLRVTPESDRDPEEALTHARRAIELAPDSGPIYDTLVAALLALDRGQEAVEALRQALERIPPDDRMRPSLQSQLDDLVGSDGSD